jgi:diguanylate cyclase (GGDEF)-like protein/PAS domain S-box-containing protein
MDVAHQTSSESKLRRELQDSETKYILTTEVTSDGIWSWDLSSDRIEYSARWKSMIGCGEQEINHSPVEWLVRVHPTDIEKLKTHLAECWQGKIERFEVEYSLLHRDGQYRLMQCKCIAVPDADGTVSHLIGAQTDITQNRQIQARLDYGVDHDRLTKLPNRQLFIEKLQELSQLEQHPDYSFGILCLDLDRFKNINHNFGDLIGDRLLVEIVRKLESCLRPQDMLARLGGDEFAVLLTSFVGEERPAAIASQIQQQLSTPIRIAEHSILVSISIGIATPDTNDLSGNTANELLQSLQNAEIAMYQAKARGKACNEVFESSLHLQSLEKNRSEDDLRKALEQEQFVLHYQPLVQLVDRQLVGFEALIRWEHPSLGMIPPGDFIPLAEATGLITPIGWWVLRSACEQMVQWQQDFQAKSAKSIFISVNITGKQFSQPYAGDIIAQILAETGLNPRCLKLEITESEIIENITLVLPTVKRLKSLGVQLSMDDFGTGYSSLSYLHCLPVDTLKIDRSFIRGMESDRHQLELVKTIIKLAEVFELDLVAEGIETETQCAELIALQCKYGQGYLFSQAVNSAIATTLLLELD